MTSKPSGSPKVTAFILPAFLLTAFAAYCYLSNLSGALACNSDENRAYHFQLFTPMLYFVCRPFIHFFKSLDAPYYVQGVTGLLSITMTVWIVRRTLSSSAAWIAAVFLILYDYPLVYSKMLFYTNLHYFLITASVAVYLEALRRGSRLLYAAAGLLAGALVTVNASGIVPAAFLILFYLATHRLEIFYKPKIPLMSAAVALGAGVASAFFFFEAWLTVWYSTYPNLDRIRYFQAIRSYGEITPTFYDLGPAYTVNQIAGIAKESLSRWEGGWFRGALILAAVTGGAGLALKRRDPRPAAWGIFLMSGLCAVILLACVKAQPFFARTLVWTVIPVTVLTAYAVENAWKSSRGMLRPAVAAVLAAYVFFAAQKCLAVTHATWSVNPILRYLDERGIGKPEVASALPINRYRDIYDRSGGDRRTADLPILITRDPEAIAQRRSHLLNWPLILNAYGQGRIRYVLVPGLGGLVRWVGERDPLLAGLPPVAEWDHPLFNRHLNTDRRVERIRLYDLKDVFARPGALEYVRAMDEKFRSRNQG